MKAIIKHLSKDPILRRIIPDTPLSINDRGNLYDALLRSIVGQQLSVKAASTIHGRFMNLYNSSPTVDELLATDTETLRSVGLSYQKSGYVKNVATYFKEHKLDKADWSAKSDKEIITQLTTIKGVGKWTVQMILMFSLQRPDVFPVDDLGIKNAMIQLYQLTETGKDLKKRMIELSQPWSPYRTYACRMLWDWKDNTALK